MGASSTAQINQHLTNYASGLSQDLGKSLADFIAPPVPTGTANGQYKLYNAQNAFQVYNTRRAVGGRAKRIEFEATDPFFNCAPNALEIPIDDHEREKAGTTANQLEEAKTRTLVTSATLSHENEVFTKIFAGLSATGGVGVWSSASADPIDEIDQMIQAISNETGMMPNRIALGIGAWRVLKNHPKVTTKISGTAGVLTLDMLAGMLLNPGMEVRVGVLSKDTIKFGGTKTAVNIVGAEAIIFYGQGAPNVYDPSFAKTFRTVEGGVDSVMTYRDEPANSDIVRVNWTDDIQVTSTSCARRITLS